MKETYFKAKISILSSLFSNPKNNSENWRYCFTDKPVVGDLVALGSAPSSKWYISWLIEVNPNKGWPKYLLKSIEDGALCWWENVGFHAYVSEKISPDWKWSDRQFKFYDRWRRVAYKKHGAYIVLPGPTIFGDDDSVTLKLRERFGGHRDDNQFHFEKTFPRWQKTTMEMMSEFYLKGCRIKDALDNKIKREREANERRNKTTNTG